MIKKINRGRIIDFIVLLYTFSLIISKFGITLFGGILAIFSIIFIFKNKEKNKYSLFFFLFLLGIVTQIFSVGGIKSTINFAYKNLYLIIPPFLINYLNRKKVSQNLLKVIEVSLFIGILKSFYNFYKIYDFTYTSNIRVDSFFDIGRWGIVLVMSLLLILPNLYKKNIFSWIVFISGIISLVLNNSRGPLLSFILGIVIFLILGKKVKSMIAIFLTLCLFFTINIYKSNSVINEFIKRTNTISVTTSGGNGARLFMWKENINFMFDAVKEGNKQLFYFGTGVKNREELFKNYIEKKEEYINLREDIKIGVSYNDAHNAYLNMFIQTGLIYTIIYYVILMGFSLKVFINYLKNKDLYTLSALAAIGAFYFCGIFYGYSFTYETFLFFFILSLGLLEKTGGKNDINIRS